jgi:TetR/AcrR family transcriptional repressor of nem operon
MGRPRRFDPDAVIDGAMRTFWQRGYRDTSVERLVEVTGVNPGSLYNAFEGGKRGLFMESLQRYSDLVVPEKLGALEAEDASPAEVRAYFDGLVEDLSAGRAGCLIVNSTIELAAADSEVSRLARAHMRRLERNMERALRNAGIADPAAKAALLMATAMGLMVVALVRPAGRAGPPFSRPHF